MRCALPLLALVSFAFAHEEAPKPSPAKGALKAIQGDWVLVNTISEGVETRVELNLVWRIKGDRLSHVPEGTVGPPLIMLSPGGSKKSRTMDMTADDAKPVLAVFQLKRDTLTVATGETRPEDLSGRGRDSVVWVLKRKKR